MRYKEVAPMRFLVDHEPVWAAVEFQGVRVGYRCIHVLENGNGECSSAVLNVSDAIGNHTCIVDGPLAPW